MRYKPSKFTAVSCCLAVSFAALAIIAGVSALVEIFDGSVYSNTQQTEMSSASDDHEIIRGVNLGGWLVLEPWIVPSLFYQFMGSDKPARDEKTFCEVLGSVEARRQLDAFRESWVTLATFQKLHDAGINAVRIPYGYWVFGDRPEFCPNISSIRFLDRAIQWASSFGMQVKLDLHGAKGGQNANDNCGEKFGPPWTGPWSTDSWARDPANVDVTLQVLGRVAARYAGENHVTMWGLVNEPWETVDLDVVSDFYDKAYEHLKLTVDSAAFQRVSPVMDVSFRPLSWEHMNVERWHKAGSRGAMLDWHPYFAFGTPLHYPQRSFLLRAGCKWYEQIGTMEDSSLPVVIGEWSVATTSCMTWLLGFGVGSGEFCSYVPCPQTYGVFPPGRQLAGQEGSDAPPGHCPVGPRDFTPPGKLNWDEFYKLLTVYSLRSFERSRGWFFWNFKNEVGDAQWSFLDAWERGWFPRNLSTARYAPPIPNCSETLFGGLLVATIVALVSGALALICTCPVFIACFRAHKRLEAESIDSSTDIEVPSSTD